MAEANAVWNAYIERYQTEPADASKLAKFSQSEDSLPTLNFKAANECLKANKGKGKVDGGDKPVSPVHKRPKDSEPAQEDSKEADAPPVNALFAQLNKGGDITKGLKKVTRDMTNKDKKISGKISDSGPKPKAKAAPKKAAPKKVKPPSIRKQGFRIWVENYVEGVEEIADATIKNEIYIVNCRECGFKVSSKVKQVTIDSCKKVQCEIEAVLTGIDMINTKGSTLYLKKQAPTLNIDKCEAPRIVLYQEILDTNPQIITSMTSDMNISLPGATEEDDFKDVPIPYQFTTTVDPKTKEVKTVAMVHSG